MNLPKPRFEYLPYLLILPAMLGICVFFFYPFIVNIYTSFMTGTVQAGTLRFVGIGNYKYVLGDPLLVKALGRTFVWTFMVTVFQFLSGFTVALVCNSGPYITRRLKPVFILPWAVPSIVTTLSWRWMLNGDFGVLNSVLYRLGIIKEYIGWLSNPGLVMFSVIFMAVWKGAPFYVLMIFAGLQTVPAELYEAARIDGANGIYMFRKITLPLLKNLLVMSLTLGVIWTTNYFEGIYALTGGGPARATETLPLYIYNTAFAYYRMNDAVVPSILLFLICSLLGLFYIWFGKKGQEEA